MFLMCMYAAVIHSSSSLLCKQPEACINKRPCGSPEAPHTAKRTVSYLCLFIICIIVR